jgi:hypothetical protein
MNINDLTLGQIREIQALGVATIATSTAPTACPWQVGKNYFIRTVTHHLTGRLIQVTQQELVLQDAAWIADDGRFTQAVASGEFAEVEPFPPGLSVIVGRGALIDATVINTLPRSQK